jgi:hypothetical protein
MVQCDPSRLRPLPEQQPKSDSVLAAFAKFEAERQRYIASGETEVQPW